jgi:hypothetical protein
MIVRRRPMAVQANSQTTAQLVVELHRHHGRAALDGAPNVVPSLPFPSVLPKVSPVSSLTS